MGNRNVQNVVFGLGVSFRIVLTPIYVHNPRRECLKCANLSMTVQSNAVDSNANALMANAFQIQLFQLFRSRKNRASIQERAACSLNNAAVLTNAKPVDVHLIERIWSNSLPMRYEYLHRHYMDLTTFS